MLALIATMPLLAQRTVKVVDALDGQPIEKVTITGDHGLYIGTTDKTGMLPAVALQQKKLALRHIAYKTKDVRAEKVDSVIRLEPNTYTIPDVTIATAARHTLYTRCYYRIYQLQDSCLYYFKEGFMDTFNGKHLLSKTTSEHTIKSRTLVSPEAERRKSGKMKSDSWLFQFMMPSLLGARHIEYKEDVDSTAENMWASHYRNGQLKTQVFRYPDRGITIANVYTNLSKDGDLNLWAVKLMGGFKRFSVINDHEEQIYNSIADTLWLEKFISCQDRMKVIMQRRKEDKVYGFRYSSIFLC